MKKNFYRCQKCGKIQYAQTPVCTADGCDGQIFDTFEIDDTCSLLSWSKVVCLPEGIDGESRIFGVVKFENGLCALGIVEAEGALYSGMPLKATIGSVRNRMPSYGNTEESVYEGLILKAV